MLCTVDAELGGQGPGVAPRGVLGGPEPLLAHQWSKPSPMSRALCESCNTVLRGVSDS